MKENKEFTVNKAIIVVDMIGDFVDKEGRAYVSCAKPLVPFIQGEIQYFRERNRHVIFALTALEEKAPFARKDSQGARITCSLQPRPGEKVVEKSGPSAFMGTELYSILQEKGISRLTLVGVETHTSILLTAADALFRGYEVAVPETCVCSRKQTDHQMGLHLIHEGWADWARASQDKSLMSENER